MVNAKGSTKECCCDGCHEEPLDWYNAGSQRLETQRWLQYCCTCIPKNICVTVSCESLGQASSKVFERDCTAEIDDSILWSGNIPFQGDRIDFEIRFAVVNGICYICLSSTYLGTTGDPDVSGECIRIGRGERHPGPYHSSPGFCETLEVDGEPIAWDIVQDDTGTGTVICNTGTGTGTSGECFTLSLTPTSAIPIIGRKPCIDNVTGKFELDEHVIRNLCGCCSCVCNCIDLIYTINGIATVKRVCLQSGFEDTGTGTGTQLTVDPVWRMDIEPGGGVGFPGTTIEVSLQRNEDTGECQLALTRTPSGVVDSGTIFPIGDQTENQYPCPRPSDVNDIRWETFGPNGITDDPVTIEWKCASCEQETFDAGPDGECFCIEMLPRILTATISISSSFDCLCGEITISLQYSAVESKWIGTHPTAFCDHEITIEVTCGTVGCPDEWFVEFRADPCLGTEFCGGTSCNPINIVHTYVEELAIGCCGDDDGGLDDHTITITITE